MHSGGIRKEIGERERVESDGVGVTLETRGLPLHTYFPQPTVRLCRTTEDPRKKCFCIGLRPMGPRGATQPI